MRFPVRLRPTSPSDLRFVLALECDPENTPFIGQWAWEEHEDAIRREDREHWIIEDGSTGDRVGYLIAYDLTPQDCGIYLKRIVVSQKSKGLGRLALERFAAHAFRDLAARYVWLGVYPENERAQRAYRAIGFNDFVASESELARHSATAERGSGGRRQLMALATDRGSRPLP